MSVNMKQSGNLIPIASLTKAIIPLGIGDCYSTEERQVGCWIDGKPLYQKTYIFTSGSSQGWTVVDASPSNVDYIQVIECMVGGYSAGAAIAAGACIFPYASASSIEVYCSSGYTNKSGTITVQYTKTTDTAGSGIWTPSGTYAKHMSTTEQVVGTYLGETVYAKVIDNLNVTLNSSAWNNIANIAGAKDLVDLKMWGYFTEYYLINYSLAHIDSGGQGLLEIRVDSEANTRIVKRIYAEYTKTS